MKHVGQRARPSIGEMEMLFKYLIKLDKAKQNYVLTIRIRAHFVICHPGSALLENKKMC